ncbi:UDP-N-acetylmuramoyl-L-alanyl-D-glutamate--2,6-diaminopimelate ligase [Patescibacteria group bacterium]|nr:UDP-N-acetylmuramoyl-L-alanyl-D-glutamate--2,6-diaminopimelate ligase [Patescibacteria group bacterium]
MVKKVLKKILPSFVWRFYYWSWSFLASLFYGHPSSALIVVGITGTAGKSTVTNLICRILEEAGYRVGLTTTFNFRIAGEEFENKKKMTMLGRFALQKLLAQMKKKGCDYALIETTSQGIEQYRHWGINYDVGIFTNLSPEHIEWHGSFEKYRQAKEKLFAHLSRSSRKRIKGQIIPKTSIINLDDASSPYFLKYDLDQKYGYTLKDSILENKEKNLKIVSAQGIKEGEEGLEFKVDSFDFSLNLKGIFNASNALAALTFALSQKIDLKIGQKALSCLQKMPGRMEIVVKKPFQVVVDYAHTPNSLEKVYQTFFEEKKRMICVLGSAGGGRDKSKRPLLGALAEQYADQIIVTNEDPYDEDPQEIIDHIKEGIKTKKYQEILDRRQAIERALEIAQPGDTVIITGKGCEPWIMGARGQKIPWDDRLIVKEYLKSKS